MRRKAGRGFERAREVPLREACEISQHREPDRLGEMLHEVIGGAPDLQRRQAADWSGCGLGTEAQEVDTNRDRERIDIELVELFGLSAFVSQALREPPKPVVAEKARLLHSDQLLPQGFGNA